MFLCKADNHIFFFILLLDQCSNREYSKQNGSIENGRIRCRFTINGRLSIRRRKKTTVAFNRWGLFLQIIVLAKYGTENFL